jgi:non-ribosomal peptide synthetase component E (peptide arylation enzyme)
MGERSIAVVKTKSLKKKDAMNHQKNDLNQGIIPKWRIPDDIVIVEDLPCSKHE